MSPLACNAAEPIPGYTVRERIGTGGYGEVWCADAPGGLTKAIKFVYGYLSDERAGNELKALSRIKEVRHPFLLSLERIEVIDGQLVIVSELAEESLKDRFEACKVSGLTGIAREDLLLLLGDAADALDYMREQHALQHLDVKPENLLLLGGRIKVADFGLVKDVYATGASLMGGMTPVYASPEVFDGRPSRHSDQYSLAIVYQEMLTGVLPFSGRTAAQLAKQHTTSSPRVTPLPAADQPIIATALAKDPDARFPSCRALIDSLRGASLSPPGGPVGPRVKSPADPEATADTTAVAASETHPTSPIGEALRREADPQPSTVKTVSLDGEEPSVRQSGTARRSAPSVRKSDVHRVIQDLPPIEMATEPAIIPPTLVLGIGGTGARTLMHLRRRLHDRFGDLADVPALQFLLLDTDSHCLVQATRGEDGAALTERETAALPLRRPQEYRSGSGELLSWLSRRWLYNIPRSLQTEGRRPLGRLAFVDHAQQLIARIRQAIAAATDEVAIAHSAEKTGAVFRAETPRVLIVASISGGTGSGMVLDVVYAVRKVLAELGLATDGICGFLAHSTSCEPGTRDLAITNAYACLGELYTYSHPEGYYPGDPALQLAPVEGETPTFNDTYLVHLGDDLSEPRFDAAADSLAEYLYLDAVTSGRAFFHQCRQLERSDRAAYAQDVAVRTFGICRMGCGRDPVVVEAANALCKHVIARWCGDGTPTQQNDDDAEPNKSVLSRRPGREAPSAADTKIDRLASRQTAELGLDVDEIVKQLYEIVRQQLDGDQETYFRKLLQELGEDHTARQDPTQPLEACAIRTIDSILGRAAGSGQNEGPYQASAATSLNTSLATFLEQHTDQLRATLRDWILHQADTVGVRIAGAARAADWLAEHVKEMESRARREAEHVEGQLVQAARTIVGNASSKKTPRRSALRFNKRGMPKTNTARLLVEYANFRLHAVVLRGVCRLAQSLQGSIATTAKQIRDMQEELGRVGDAFEMLISRAAASRDAFSGGPVDHVPAAFADAIQRRIPELAAQLDIEFQKNFVDPRGGLPAVLTGNLDHRAKLPAALRSAARSVIRPALREIDVAQLVDPSNDSADQVFEHLQTCLDRATPRLLKCGGSRRLLVVLPEGSPNTLLAERIEQQASTLPTVTFDEDVDVALCCEVERLPLAAAATSLVEGQPDLIEIAARVHTRNDLEWSKLEEVQERI